MNAAYNRIGITVLCLTMLTGIAGCASTKMTSSSDVPRMSIDTLFTQMDDPSIRILDVRLPSSQKSGMMKIKGAIRENPNDYLSWAEKYPKSQTLVLY